MAINPKKYIDKLMKALEAHGKYYNYSQKRFYSKNVDRYVMKYILEDASDKKRRMEVYNKLEVLKFLVREFSEVTGQPVPEACLEALDEHNVTAIDGGTKLNGLGVPVFENFKKNYPEHIVRPKFENGYKKKTK